MDENSLDNLVKEKSKEGVKKIVKAPVDTTKKVVRKGVNRATKPIKEAVNKAAKKATKATLKAAKEIAKKALEIAIKIIKELIKLAAQLLEKLAEAVGALIATIGWPIISIIVILILLVAGYQYFLREDSVGNPMIAYNQNNYLAAVSRNVTERNIYIIPSEAIGFNLSANDKTNDCEISFDYDSELNIVSISYDNLIEQEYTVEMEQCYAPYKCDLKVNTIYSISSNSILENGYVTEGVLSSKEIEYIIDKINNTNDKLNKKNYIGHNHNIYDYDSVTDTYSDLGSEESQGFQNKQFYENHGNCVGCNPENYIEDGGIVYHIVSRDDLDSDRDRFNVHWQEVLALCQIKSLSNAGEWGQNNNNSGNIVFAFLQSLLKGLTSPTGVRDEYFITTMEIDDIYNLFSYNIEYYYDLNAQPDFTYFKYNNMGNSAWRYYDVDKDCDLTYSYTGTTYRRSCKYPVAAPSYFENGYEYCIYEVTDLTGASEDTMRYFLGDKYVDMADYSDVGGVITARTIHYTPHAFVDKCEAITNGAFDFTLYLQLLQVLPDSEEQYNKMKKIYDLYCSTENDDDPTLVFEERGNTFSSYGTIIGNGSSIFSTATPSDNSVVNVSRVDLGEDGYMYVDARHNRVSEGVQHLEANSYYVFPDMAFKSVLSNDGYNFATYNKFCESFQNKYNLCESGYFESFAAGFYWADVELGMDITFPLAIFVGEGPIHKQYAYDPSKHNKDWPYGSIAKRAHNFTYNYGNAASGKATNTIRPIYSTGAWKDTMEMKCPGYKELSDYINNNAKDNIKNGVMAYYGKSNFADLTNDELYDYFTSKGYLSVKGRMWRNTRYVVLSNSDYVSDMLSKWGRLDGKTYRTISELSEEQIRSYCVYYTIKDMKVRWVDNGQYSPFLFNWKGIDIDDEGYPIYTTQSEVEGYRIANNKTLSDKIRNSYGPWFDNITFYDDGARWINNCINQDEWCIPVSPMAKVKDDSGADLITHHASQKWADLMISYRKILENSASSLGYGSSNSSNNQSSEDDNSEENKNEGEINWEN